MTPHNRLPQCLLPIWEIARTTGEQGEPPVEASQECGRGEQLEARSRQLESERQPIQAPADLGNRHGVVIGKREVRIGVLGSRSKQLHRWHQSEFRMSDWSSRFWQGEWRHWDLALSTEPQADTAGRQDGETAATRQQFSDEGHCREDVLAVIQNQETLPVP
jgi:hypothetical protein